MEKRAKQLEYLITSMILLGIGMLFFFILGAVTGTVFCHLLVGRAIWLTMIPLGIIFLTLLHADRTTEKELVEQKPAGHCPGPRRTERNRL